MNKEQDINPDNELETSSTEGVEGGTIENTEEVNPLSELEQLQFDLADQKDKFLRLYSEFDNFRRRTAKEKLELSQQAGARVLNDLLPVIDDFERAQNAFETSSDVTALREGLALVYNKFYKTVEQNGVKPMNCKGKAFDPELHEAITQIPAPSKDLVGKVVDEVEKGYFLNDKVLRFAKVVIGA